MSDSLGNKNESPLYTEHLLLGATFGKDGLVRRYANEQLDCPAPSNGCFLADITHLTTYALFGDAAKSFSEAAFAGSKLAVGECEYEAVLSGDGSIASVPLLARTGVNEYVAFDFSPRGAILMAWLDFVRSASKDGVAPYQSLGCQDATGTHCVLAIWGGIAKTILEDYTAANRLPKPGHIVSCNLDKIPCIIARIDMSNMACYFVLVPPASSVALWRSLLSFSEVEPVGVPSFTDSFTAANPWFKSLCTTDVVRMSANELRSYGLLRSQADFIGARGLIGSNRGEA